MRRASTAACVMGSSRRKSSTNCGLPARVDGNGRRITTTADRMGRWATRPPPSSPPRLCSRGLPQKNQRPARGNTARGPS